MFHTKQTRKTKTKRTKKNIKNRRHNSNDNETKTVLDNEDIIQIKNKTDLENAHLDDVDLSKAILDETTFNDTTDTEENKHFKETIELFHKKVGKHSTHLKNVGNTYCIGDETILRKNEHIDIRITYEEYNGTKYPILFLPKGMLLFTGRNLRNKLKDKMSEQTSFRYLYKLNGDQYISNDLEDTYTYFYPIAYAYKVALPELDFDHMNCVSLIQDVKLLCLLSPVSITRGIRHDNYPEIKTCNSRDYDICMTKELVMGLKLNGYISIATMDALSTHIEWVQGFFNKWFKQPFEETVLYNSSVFNNDKCDNVFSTFSEGTTLHDKMVKYRHYGIPEIVLIPYDIHQIPKTRKIGEYMNEIKEKYNQTDENIVYDTDFLFKPIFHATDYEPAKFFRKIILEINKLSFSTIKTMPGLFYILNSEKKSDDMIVNNVDEYDYDFTDPNNPCLFESIGFYNQTLRQMKTGGREPIYQSILGSDKHAKDYKHKFIHPQKHKFIKSKSFKKQTSPKHITMKKTAEKQMHIHKSDEPIMFYETVNGMPVFYFSETSKSRKHSNKKNTLNQPRK
jgi:hypothetical protein